MHRYQRWVDAYLDGELPEARRSVFEEHLGRCRSCGALVQDGRRLMRRLDAHSASRSSAPAPGAELLNRLSRTSEFSFASAGEPPQPPPAPARWRSLLPALACALVIGLLTAILAVAWVLGEDGGGRTASASSVVGGWTEAGVQLKEEDLDRLRDAGWNCPQFAAFGLAVTGARGAVVEGVPELTLELAGPGGTAVVTERRRDPATAGAASSGTKSMALNAASEVATVETGADGRSVLSMESAEYELISTLDKESTRALLRRIVVTEHARLDARGLEEQPALERIGRGLAKLTVVDIEQ
jgi:anti-sigma factor RsiW